MTSDGEESEEEQDEEPRLKYSRLTVNLKDAGVYRNDSTSSLLVAGDKMVRYLEDMCENKS